MVFFASGTGLRPVKPLRGYIRPPHYWRAGPAAFGSGLEARTSPGPGEKFSLQPETEFMVTGNQPIIYLVDFP